MLVQQNSFMISPCGKYAWINIPKNASSFTKTILETNNWKLCKQEVMYNPDIEKFAYLEIQSGAGLVDLAKPCWIIKYLEF